jgi:hypothetical protein
MSRETLVRWGAVGSVVGGILWVVLFAGHTFAHGSTQTPREATVLGLSSLDFLRLLAIPPLLFMWGLWSARATQTAPLRPLGRAGYFVSLTGLAMVALGVVLETWIVDPSLDFSHPFVQGGSILFLFGLFPTLTIGMILFGVRASGMRRSLRVLAVVIGVLTPLQLLEVFLSSWSTGTVPWDLLYTALRGLVGLAWVAFGVSLWSEVTARRSRGSVTHTG